jgi:Holliday junction resolvasome RuvABC endonuclease subunit
MRLLRLRGKLQEIKNNAGVDLIIFEAARHAAPGMAGAVVVQSEIQGVIKLWAEENKIPYRGFSPSEVKKRATGKGNANKQAVMDAAKEHWGRLISDDNEADALWLLVLGQETLGIKERPHDVETGL